MFPSSPARINAQSIDEDFIDITFALFVSFFSPVR